MRDNDQDWVACPACSPRATLPGPDPWVCYLCAREGVGAAPGEVPRACAVEWALIAHEGTTAATYLRVRKNHGLSHPEVDGTLESLVIKLDLRKNTSL